MTTTVSDVFQLGHLSYQTDGAGTVLASYSYDVFGVLTSSSENFLNNTSGWSNPYRYDGRDGVRYDSETGLYWMSVRAYDPALGRFLQHDPLGRAPLFFADQPYVYAGNNPLVNVDPSGQLAFFGAGDMQARARYEPKWHRVPRIYARYRTQFYHPCSSCQRWTHHAQDLQNARLRDLDTQARETQFFAGSLFALTLVLDFMSAKDAITKLEFFLGLGGALTGYLLPGLGGWIQDAHPEWGSVLRTFQYIAAGINQAMGLVADAVGIYKTWGWLAQHAVDAAVWAIQGLIGGVPGELENIAWQTLGEGIAGLGIGYANQLESLSTADFAEEDRERHASLQAWCAQFANGACGPVPTS